MALKDLSSRDGASFYIKDNIVHFNCRDFTTRIGFINKDKSFQLHFPYFSKFMNKFCISSDDLKKINEQVKVLYGQSRT